ncbi:TetR/AcrR family transcriptional regulator [Ectopseudomonas hydrolytica]|uniref:TetR/AcrR family transcriptional regulator n=1 Tax=Ectopseudomonas hydrolytica TaxID=2493633 RepID=UPI003EE1CFD1
MIDPAPEPRSVRRKRETRLRLMKAAFDLMSEHGKDDVTISAITEAADVGFGTFYNYFPSKEAIYEALVEEVLERSGSVVDEAARHISDPAERLSVGVRCTLLQAQSDLVWGAFLARGPLNAQLLSKGLGKFLMRDVHEGVDQGRFRVDDLAMTLMAIVSTVHGVLTAELERARSSSTDLDTFQALGLDPERMPERTAAIVLRILGVDASESDTISRRPLPPLESFLRVFN